MSLPAASLTASGQPASPPAPARPRPPPGRAGGWLHRLDSTRSPQGVCRVQQRNSAPGHAPGNLLLLPRLPLPAAIRPCQPYHWPGTSPIAPRTHITHPRAHTRTHSQSLPRLPALTYRRPLLHRIASQACSRARGAPSHRSKRFLFSLGHPAPRPARLSRGIRCKQPGSSRQS